MKATQKKSLVCLLVFLMILMFIPTTAYGTNPTILRVNGTDIIAAADNTVQCGEGTAKYDADSNTLTLENATMEGDFNNSAVIYAPKGDLKINLIGENTIKSTGNMMVVYASSGSVEIAGKGFLSISAKDACIWAGNGGVTVSGATLNLISSGSDGIYANNKDETAPIFIKDNAHVTIDALNLGIACSGDLSVSDSFVEASTSGDQANTFYSWNGKVDISNSTVKAKETSEDAYPTVWAQDGVNISNDSDVNVSSTNSNAIFTPNSLTVTDSVFEASSTEWAVWCEGSIYFSGGTVKTYDKGGEFTNAAVYAGEKLTVSNGADVLADGGLDVPELTVIPESGKLVEYKAGIHENGEDGAKHRGDSPYSEEFSIKYDDIKLGYTYIHIKEHIHTGGSTSCISGAVCSDCGMEYGKAAGHSAVKTDAKEPTATESGNIEFWYCDDCGKYFKDKDLTQEITKEQTIIKAIGEEKPSQPPQQQETADDKKIDNPQTGDSNDLVLLLALFIACGGAAVGIISFDRKKKYNK